VLGYFSTDPIYRKYKHNQLTFGAMYQFTENFVQAFSHDEVVHGKGSLVNKMNLAYQEDRIANLRALFALQWLWPGKKTLFMGCEFGQWTEWDFENQLDWALLDFPNHQGLKQLIADLNKLYIEHSTWAAVDHQSDKFRWIDCNDQDGQTLSFLKFGHYPTDTLLIACNFSDHLQHRNWGCPHAGTWEVLLDSDSPAYQGQGAGGGTTFNTMDQSCNDQPYSLSFSVNRWSVRVLAKTSEA
jgi:1,4-alpha-glucan branching enzyme